MNGIFAVLETAKAVVKANERKETGLVALLIPSLKGEIEEFEKEHFGWEFRVASPRSEGVPSRQEVYKDLKARSLELQGTPK